MSHIFSFESQNVTSKCIKDHPKDAGGVGDQGVGESE